MPCPESCRLSEDAVAVNTPLLMWYCLLEVDPTPKIHTNRGADENIEHQVVGTRKSY